MKNKPKFDRALSRLSDTWHTSQFSPNLREYIYRQFYYANMNVRLPDDVGFHIRELLQHEAQFNIELEIEET